MPQAQHFCGPALQTVLKSRCVLSGKPWARLCFFQNPEPICVPHLLAPSSVFPVSHDLVGPFWFIISASAVALLGAWPSLETCRIAWDPPRLKTGSFPHLKIFTYHQPSPLFHFIGCWWVVSEGRCSAYHITLPFVGNKTFLKHELLV